MVARKERRFNRNIVECKGVPVMRSCMPVFHDLIETSWNVKDVEIDEDEIEKGGFNRNIVECKETGASGHRQGDAGI